jgi:hypothetical protein
MSVTVSVVLSPLTAVKVMGRFATGFPSSAGCDGSQQ